MSKRLKIEITMWLILLFTLSQKGFSQILNCYEHFLEGRYHQAIQCFTKVTTDEEFKIDGEKRFTILVHPITIYF